MKACAPIIAVLIFGASCSEKNAGTSRESITPEQKAQEAMNLGDYDKAIELLAPLVEEQPDEHLRKPLLAAAYAGLVGVDVLAILTRMLSSDSESSSSVFDQISVFLPEDLDSDDLELMRLSIAVLESIPTENLGPDGDPDYGVSAEVQLVLYRTIYTTMLLEVLLDLSGGIDLDALRNLSEAEIDMIFSALRDAALGGASDGAIVIGSAADRTLSDIDAEEGDSDRERLANHFEG
jgi:hypothetical protein